MPYRCLYHVLNCGLVAVCTIGAIIACLGVYPTIAVNLAWAGGNAGGDAKRGVVIAMVIGIGNLGGYVLYISQSHALANWQSR